MADTTVTLETIIAEMREWADLDIARDNPRSVDAKIVAWADQLAARPMRTSLSRGDETATTPRPQQTPAVRSASERDEAEAMAVTRYGEPSARASGTLEQEIEKFQKRLSLFRYQVPADEEHVFALSLMEDMLAALRARETPREEQAGLVRVAKLLDEAHCTLIGAHGYAEHDEVRIKVAFRAVDAAVEALAALTGAK
jgi:hypothetical protein